VVVDRTTFPMGAISPVQTATAAFNGHAWPRRIHELNRSFVQRHHHNSVERR
jgi:hypothetical protein